MGLNNPTTIKEQLLLEDLYKKGLIYYDLGNTSSTFNRNINSVHQYTNIEHLITPGTLYISQRPTQFQSLFAKCLLHQFRYYQINLIEIV